MKTLLGNTYSIKDQIKAKGGRWDSTSKTWSVPDEHYDELSKMLPCKKLTGQLWEECRRCGQEPVYISLGCLCENCGR